MEPAGVMLPESISSIQENYRRVLEKIAHAAEIVRRDPKDVKLVVVTKLQPVAVIEAAIETGARSFGENYAEQAAPKIEKIGNLPGIEWHMIGHVQSRKAGLVCEHFSMIHSLDSLKLAEKMESILTGMGKEMPALLEFNLGGEESKHGWDATDDSSWGQVFSDVEKILQLRHLNVCGCMTMPPYAEDPEQSRGYFRKLVRLRETLADRFPQTNWRHLSIGTSGDYEVAVQEGATIVRVGQAILGSRPGKMTGD